MNVPSKDVCDMLEAESSLGLTFNDNLFLGRRPATPDNCVVIYDTPGREPEATLTNDVRLYRPSIQVAVRNRSYTLGYAVISDIVLVLHGRGPETWNDTVYGSILASSDIALLEWDANNRAVFVVNLNLMRRPN